jgi:uncharacterized protein YdeI (BOF family)
MRLFKHFTRTPRNKFLAALIATMCATGAFVQNTNAKPGNTTTATTGGAPGPAAGGTQPARSKSPATGTTVGGLPPKK